MYDNLEKEKVYSAGRQIKGWGTRASKERNFPDGRNRNTLVVGIVT